MRIGIAEIKHECRIKWCTPKRLIRSKQYVNYGSFRLCFSFYVLKIRMEEHEELRTNNISQKK